MLYIYQKPFGHSNISQLFNMFDSMVKPVLTYGSQIWGYKYTPEIETVQLSFCKRYLNIQQTIVLF